MKEDPTKISRIDHIVLTATNLEKTCNFYKKILIHAQLPFLGLFSSNDNTNLKQKKQMRDLSCPAPARW